MVARWLFKKSKSPPSCLCNILVSRYGSSPTFNASLWDLPVLSSENHTYDHLERQYHIFNNFKKLHSLRQLLLSLTKNNLKLLKTFRINEINVKCY